MVDVLGERGDGWSGAEEDGGPEGGEGGQGTPKKREQPRVWTFNGKVGVMVWRNTQRVISAPFPQNTRHTRPKYSDLSSDYMNIEVLVLTSIHYQIRLNIFGSNRFFEYFFECFFQK